MWSRLIPFVLFASRLCAEGGPPMLTDDPGTPGAGHWEINSAFVTEHRSGIRVSEMPLFDLNYGVGDRWQLKYEASWTRLHDDKGRRDGFSNSLIGVKWRFYDATDQGLSISTYPQVELNNPGSHAVARGLASHGTGLVLPVEVEKDFGAFEFNVDAGLVRHPDEDRWFGGIAIGRKVGHEIELAAELHWEASQRFHATELIANVGAHFSISEKFTLLTSVGRDLHDRRESKASLIAYLGLQTRL